MADKNVILKDNEGNNIYPRTITSNVFGADGVSMQSIIDAVYNINTTLDNKVDTSVFNGQIATITSTLNDKANTSYVNTELGKKNNTISLTNAGSGAGMSTRSGYVKFILSNVAGKKLVFYRQFSNSQNNTFQGSTVFSTVLLAWVEQASTSDTQSQRTTMTGLTTTGWSITGGYYHWINVIGLE